MAQDILKTIQSPKDLRALTDEQLTALCEELRQTLVETVSHTGGHLASNLGVVELTVALERAFGEPNDDLLFDVGHQCYVHKLLTGRQERFSTLRQTGGLSGFPHPQESAHDPFIMGHSSTSISAAAGMACGKALSGRDGYTVAVLGDGALTGGMVYEGLENIAEYGDKVIIVLNDNRMSISRNVGYVARHLARLRSRPRYVRAKGRFGKAIGKIPLIGRWLYRKLFRFKKWLKNAVYGSSTLFEEMGLYYLGPVDGHDLPRLEEALAAAKTVGRAVLLHVVTVKGKGCDFAVQAPNRYHGVSGFDAETGETPQSAAGFSSVFGEWLIAAAEKDERICAVTAAMAEGTGLEPFRERFDSRFFDVGIAEEHAVTFCSALSCRGILPVLAIYSTFLQRGYDQLINDISVMNNHVVLAVDRAGLVPGDGETHQGIYDVAYLSTVPHMTIYAPSCYAELKYTMSRALWEHTGAVAVRYPRGAEDADAAATATEENFSFYPADGADTLIITYGRLMGYALRAVRRLKEQGCSVALLKLLRLYPLDDGVLPVISPMKRVLFFEEGCRTGGIGEQLGSRLLEYGFGGEYRLYTVDQPIPCCSLNDGLKMTGLDEEGMIERVCGNE